MVQRLQRFATYSHLKQVVLRMITEEMRSRGKAPSFGAALQVREGWWGRSAGRAGADVLQLLVGTSHAQGRAIRGFVTTRPPWHQLPNTH